MRVTVLLRRLAIYGETVLNEAETDRRHREVVAAAWSDFADPRAILDVEELSAMVSTNRVYRLHLSDGHQVIAKSSNYGSFFLFAEDHDRLHRVTQLLHGGRWDGFLADVLDPRRQTLHLV